MFLFIKRILISLSIIYLLVVAGIYSFQRKILYVPFGVYQTPQKLGLDYDEVEIDTEDSLKLKAWYKKSKYNNKTILFFHGNAGNLSIRANMYKSFSDLGYGILAFTYRGFSGNGGTPNEELINKDAISAYEYLKNTGVSQEDIILFGESLGTGVAIKLANYGNFSQIILISPYTSILDVAKNHYWYLPVDLMLKDNFDSHSLVNKVEEPLLIFHGDEDNIIPISQAKKLFYKAKNPYYFQVLKGFGHNDINYLMIAKKIKELGV